MQLLRNPLKSNTPDPQNSRNHPIIEVSLLERRITFMTEATIVNIVKDLCINHHKAIISNYNVHGFNLSMHLPWFFRFQQSVDYIHCDGMGILKTVKLLGLDLPNSYHTSYTSLMPEVLKCADRNNFSIFFLGASPKNLNEALIKLRKQYPNIQLSGHHGYFLTDDPVQSDFQERQVLNLIQQHQPNILVVGMGMPLQEQWVDRNRDSLDVNVVMLGGAIIDRLAGVVPDCPRLITSLGCEWLFRLVQEPKRLMGRYIIGNPAFLLNIALASVLGIRLLSTPDDS